MPATLPLSHRDEGDVKSASVAARSRVHAVKRHFQNSVWDFSAVVCAAREASPLNAKTRKPKPGLVGRVGVEPTVSFQRRIMSPREKSIKSRHYGIFFSAIRLVSRPGKPCNSGTRIDLRKCHDPTPQRARIAPGRTKLKGAAHSTRRHLSVPFRFASAVRPSWPASLPSRAAFSLASVHSAPREKRSPPPDSLAAYSDHS
ncbi:hypothetical protein P3T23_003225 [Paraburkholderia sp. GAS448]